MGSHASPPPTEEARVLGALRRIFRHLRVSSRTAEATAGVTTAQLFVLSHLARAPAPSIRSLAARTLTDPSSVSVVVAKLVSAGLVTRSRTSRDLRRAELTLTSKGSAVLAIAPDLPQMRMVASLRAMPLARRRSIARALEDLVVAIGAEASEPRMFFDDEPEAAKPAKRASRARA